MYPDTTEDKGIIIENPDICLKILYVDCEKFKHFNFNVITMKYSKARKMMQPGDLIGFSGASLLSKIIKRVTRSEISHVGVILQTEIIDGGIWINQLIESTNSGVKINRMSDHVRDYAGNLYWYPLTDESLAKLNLKKMYKFLLTHKGKKYDAWQAVLSAFDLFPDTSENFRRMFCSELTAAGYEAGGLLKNINCSEMTPADQVNMNLFKSRVEITK
ncbi:MAG: hypothetical protein JJV89_03370 [Desulfosarcina sp.]|nr:hypothetical protein [Desulfobacterales bacterium]